MSIRNVAVVGCNGFIGKHLTEKLASDKDLNLFLFGRSAHSSLSEYGEYKQFDIHDLSKVKDHFAGIDAVYYLVSETIPATSWQQPLLELEKNLKPFIRFMEGISGSGVKKVIFLSSAGTVYGPAAEKITEGSDKQPFSPYGITKLTMEYFLNYFQVKYGINYDVYRASNVYGEGQDTSKGLGIINTFLEKIISENSITIFGDGKNTRNYLYVKDAVELMNYSIHTDPGASNIFNLSSDDTLSINQLVEITRTVVKENFDVKYLENRQSDNSFIDLDNTKIKQAYKDFKFTDISEGIKKTYLFVKQKHVNI